MNNNRKNKMTAKETIKQINELPESEWLRMKEHMDKKFPNMTLPTVEDFKELVKLYGKFKEYKEGRLN